jgi:TolB-like protein
VKSPTAFCQDLDEDENELALALRRPLVAVLPFAPAGEDAALRLLGSGLAQQLRLGLAQAPAISAILINSEFLERAPEYALELICRQLHIGHLVSGRCSRDARGNCSLYVELTDTRDWNVHWAQVFRGTAGAMMLPESTELAQLQASVQAALLCHVVR